MTNETRRTLAESALLNVIKTCKAHPNAMKVVKTVGNGIYNTASFATGLTIGSTVGTASAIIIGEDFIRDKDGEVLSDKYYVAGRTIGQTVLASALVYGIATGQFHGGLD